MRNPTRVVGISYSSDPNILHTTMRLKTDNCCHHYTLNNIFEEATSVDVEHSKGTGHIIQAGYLHTLKLNSNHETEIKTEQAEQQNHEFLQN